MIRERTLRIILVLVGLIFVAGVYPLITSVRDGWQANKEQADPMGISLYVMMGIFLLVAARNPAANRGVIVFAGWLNIAHAAVMTVMAIHLPNERQDMLIASAIFAGIGAVLILLPSAPRLSERAARNP
jgi:quinol-cytochrome oxidoreductase complex cytochrome b subunit